jgi:hypothetical protein
MRPSLSQAYGKASEILIDHGGAFAALVAIGWLGDFAPMLARKSGVFGSSLVGWGAYLFVFMATECAVVVAARWAMEGKKLAVQPLFDETMRRFPRFFGVSLALTVAGVAAMAMCFGAIFAYLLQALMQQRELLKQIGADADMQKMIGEVGAMLGGKPAALWGVLFLFGLVAVYWVCKVWYLAWLVPILEDDPDLGSFRASAALMRGRVGFLTVAVFSMMGISIVPFGLSRLVAALVPEPLSESAADLVLQVLGTYIVVLHVTVYAQLRMALQASAAAAPTEAAAHAAAPVPPRW